MVLLLKCRRIVALKARPVRLSVKPVMRPRLNTEEEEHVGASDK